ncbi:MAG: PAS domain-containing protein [Bacteroidota bacterium]
MSELIVNTNKHYLALQAYCCGMVEGKNGKALYEKYRNETEAVTAEETMQLLDYLLLHYTFEAVKNTVGKLINIFYKSLKQQIWEKPAEDHFLSYLMLENRGVEKIIDEMRIVVKALFSKSVIDENELAIQLLRHINDLKSYELHYIKKENILFPFIESTFSQYRCLQLMWSFHDDFRKTLQRIEELLTHEPIKKDLLNKELGRLFFVVLPIIFREEQIVYPVAYRAIPESAWQEMLEQAHEAGWCYINPVRKSSVNPTDKNLASGMADLDTGVLSREQIIRLFENLPVDITFVDEEDTVRYFSGGKHRIFPRSNAIIGRKVQNCHPQESVHIVNQIVEAFRKGSKNEANFWINMKGKFIYIRYIALRSSTGEYKGTIEVSQDVTDIKALEGERRLLSWEE